MKVFLDEIEDKWFFFDETDAHRIGPFDSKWEAEKMVSFYIMFLDGQFRGKLCPERSEKLIGQPLGQYHCPICGMMLIAGCMHPDPSVDNPDYIMLKEI
ncbi:MAG: hypothetical protein ACXADW_14110 [Candidatus Hodarchaeales archaeon]|jgi:hypothetical protein